MIESSKSNKNFTRESIVGLGEASFRKNYYPELQRKLLDLERINARNRTIINTIPDILLLSDVQGNIYPFTYSEKMDALFNKLITDSNALRFLRSCVSETVTSQVMYTERFRFYDKGLVKHLEARLNMTDNEEVLIMIRDITESVLMEECLKDMANRDSLTKLFNRRLFEEYLYKYEKNAPNCLTIVIADIDGLKMLNDTFGHLEGDRAIRIAAETINNVFGKKGIIARLGGDEFGILLECCNEETIEESIENVLEKIEDFNIKSDLLKLSISFGHATYNKGTEILSVLKLFAEADNNMYHNKMFKSESVRSGLVKTLMKALEAKDYITEGHADRLEQMAYNLGNRLKLSRSQLDRIKLLAKFHDIGKVGIPDKILKKPAKLNQEEYKIMKTHTQIGKRIAQESSELKEISELIYTHHERWDGKGYPLGLKGEEILVECRILSIVDAFDAMTNDRPYRKALSFETALDEIRLYKGKQFDPNIADEFLKMVQE